MLWGYPYFWKHPLLFRSKILIQLLSQVAKQHLSFASMLRGNDLKPFNGCIPKKRCLHERWGYIAMGFCTKSPKIDFTKVATVDAVFQSLPAFYQLFGVFQTVYQLFGCHVPSFCRVSWWIPPKCWKNSNRDVVQVDLRIRLLKVRFVISHFCRPWSCFVYFTWIPWH